MTTETWRATGHAPRGRRTSILKRPSAAATPTPTGTASMKFSVERKRKACRGNHGGATVEAKTTHAASASRVRMYARANPFDSLSSERLHHNTAPTAAAAYQHQSQGV